MITSGREKDAVSHAFVRMCHITAMVVVQVVPRVRRSAVDVEAKNARLTRIESASPPGRSQEEDQAILTNDRSRCKGPACRLDVYSTLLSSCPAFLIQFLVAYTALLYF